MTRRRFFRALSALMLAPALPLPLPAAPDPGPEWVDVTDQYNPDWVTAEYDVVFWAYEQRVLPNV